MKFFVRRTSLWNDEESPCEGARRVKGLITHNGAPKTLEQTKDPKWSGNFWFWDKDKINHRKTSSGVACDSEALLWQIEIESLDQLMAFIEANGRVVLEFDDGIYGKGAHLEIYDNCRE